MFGATLVLQHRFKVLPKVEDILADPTSVWRIGCARPKDAIRTWTSSGILQWHVQLKGKYFKNYIHDASCLFTGTCDSKVSLKPLYWPASWAQGCWTRGRRPGSVPWAAASGDCLQTSVSSGLGWTSCSEPAGSPWPATASADQTSAGSALAAASPWSWMSPCPDLRDRTDRQVRQVRQVHQVHQVRQVRPVHWVHQVHQVHWFHRAHQVPPVHQVPLVHQVHLRRRRRRRERRNMEISSQVCVDRKLPHGFLNDIWLYI